ncbi:MAG: protein kinase [Polyangiaceae bacterium]
MDLTSNTILANKYKLVRRLGEGGMGCVWVADHLHLDRQVAIKVISNRVISEPSVRQRFETEARATAKVDSPHVVQVLDFDYTEGGQPFLVLELLVGETLEQRLSREGVLSVSDARELMKQTTHALAEAHGAGILHRDIKADNLFVVARDDLFVKLLDFGIAIRRDRVAMPDSAVDPSELSPIGTPLYMSPEQTLALGPVDERSDLYSLAVCMYYALTGDFPFCADSLAVLAFAQQRGDFVMPSTHRPELGPAVDAFFLRAFAFNAADRFSSAQKMFEAFEKACDRLPVAHSDAAMVLPRPVKSTVVKSLAASLNTEITPRKSHAPRRSRRGIALVCTAALVATGFYLAPRGWLPSAPAVVTTTAAYVASRIPTGQVSAATEPTVATAIDREQAQTRASMIALPLPARLTNVVASNVVATNVIAPTQRRNAVTNVKVAEKPSSNAKSESDPASDSEQTAAPGSNAAWGATNEPVTTADIAPASTSADEPINP